MTKEPMRDVLSRAELERLLAIGSGDAALLLIQHRLKGQNSPVAMPGWPDERLLAARILLRDAGLLPAADSAVNAGRPAYPAAEVASGRLRDPAFAGLARECERLFGKPLSSQDLQILYGMYDWRGLPPDVLHLLIHFCAAQSERRYGSGGRPPGLRAIDKEAAVWAELGLFTHQQAEEYIREKEETQERVTQAFHKLGFSRPPSKTEKEHVTKWLSLGFDMDAIALAYDITVTNTGKMSWPYCGKIIMNWHEKNCHTVSEIEATDKKPSAAKPQAAPAKGRGGVDHAREVLQRITKD